MTHPLDNDDRDGGGPTDHGTINHDGVFGSLLRERLGDDTPPDLTDTVESAMARGADREAAERVFLAEPSLTPKSGGHRLLAAALVLLGLGVVVATQWGQESGGQESGGQESGGQQQGTTTANVDTASAVQPEESKQDPEKQGKKNTGKQEPAQNPLGPNKGRSPGLTGEHRFEVQVVDRHGGPVQHFTMSLLQVGNHSPSAFTKVAQFTDRAMHPRDFKADYAVIDGLPVGNYAVAVTADAHVMTLSAPFQIREGEPAPRFVVKLNTGGSLTGQVRDIAGRPVVGAVVRTLADRDVGIAVDGPFGKMLRDRLPKLHTEATARTDAKGNYRFTKLIHGKYAVRVEHEDFCARAAHGVLVGEDPARVHALVLFAGTSVHGIAHLDGAPAAGIRVSMTLLQPGGNGPGRTYQTMSGEDGVFRFAERVPPASYKLYGTSKQKGDNPFQMLVQMQQSEVAVAVIDGAKEVSQDIFVKSSR